MGLDRKLININEQTNAPERSSGANESERISWYMGSLQPEAEGSPTPEVAAATSFERAVTRRPTVSSR